MYFSLTPSKIALYFVVPIWRVLQRWLSLRFLIHVLFQHLARCNLNLAPLVKFWPDFHLLSHYSLVNIRPLHWADMSSTVCVFEDRFLVRSIDKSKFDRVSRINAKSTGFDAELLLDVNTDIFPVMVKSVGVIETSYIAVQFYMFKYLTFL